VNGNMQTTTKPIGMIIEIVESIIKCINIFLAVLMYDGGVLGFSVCSWCPG
jgi:hypothetical protein